MENGSSAKPVLGNRYQLIETIGTGGMAVVYHARDQMLEREVAVKLLRQRFSRDPYFRDRFHEEAKAAAKLSHPNIVTVYDFGLDNNRLFIVMEYVPGTDLKSIIKQHGKFSVKETLALMTQACFGLGYAHRVGLVHCDVKPQNMLVTPAQRLKVTDFGIARAMVTIHQDEQHDIVWGSPLYFAPEQAIGEAPSPASDVYSLGIILYEMLTGQLPFNSENAIELVRLHREVAPVHPRELNPDIPVALEQIILKVLSKNPSDRYNNADQLGRILLALGNSLETSKPASSSPRVARTAPLPVPPQKTSVQGSPEVVEIPPQVAAPVETKPKQEQEDQVEKEKSILDIDWIAIGLGLVATVAVSGLVPFWIWIWYNLSLSGK